MPDGDRIHNLPRRYTRVYKQICEGHFSSFELANETAIPLIADLKEYGNGPIRVIGEALAVLQDIVVGPLFKSMIDGKAVQRRLQRLDRNARGHKRGCQLALMACQAFVDDIRKDDITPITYERILTEKYLWKVFEVNFEQCIPSEGHYNNADNETVVARIEEMRPYFNDIIEHLANRLVQTGKVVGLRRPNQPKEPIDLNADLSRL